MKGIKLQIGDYVFIKSSSGDTALIKIAAVHQGKVGYHRTPNKLNWVRFSLLEPIPLTPEILEKNGFKHYITEENSDDFDNREGDLYYCLNRTADGYMSCIDVAHSFTISGLIKYVHELQHILRLCGLDELADNLKIEK
jgi:hypothetical protein